MSLVPGTEIGTLRIEREIGRGAFGVVYLAQDTLLRRPVALKTLPGGQGGVPEKARADLLAEARIVAGLGSPHVVALYRLRAAEDGGLLLEMEFAEGGSLASRLEEGRPLFLEEAVHVFRGVAAGLRSAHAARVVHGDVKPENVLYGADGTVKLTDFGLARRLEAGRETAALRGRMAGSPSYMAPEVLTGKETGRTADVWSASVLLYRLLSGRLPFPARNLMELLARVLREKPPPLPAEVPEGLAALVLRGLAKPAAERPATLEEVLAELDRLAGLDTRLAAREAVRERRSNLAPAATSFVGREREVASIEALIAAAPGRLVTVLGPGGIGKTRLVREACLRLADREPGGAWFADLTEARDEAAICLAAAEALGVPAAAEADLAAAVGAALDARGACVLALDNFEQVRDHAAATVGRWREAAPAARFLVTSRAVLGLPGEAGFELEPLLTGRNGAARRLFLDRARDAAPAFAPGPEDDDGIDRIVAELDGMPLAIELAAARVAVLSPEAIADRLTEKFRLLRSLRRDLAPRQKTLHGAIEWSYDLLSGAERDAFLQSCWFREGFTLEAAERVLDLAAHGAGLSPGALVRELAGKSLVFARDAGFETRLGMYRAVREFGAERWEAEVDADRREALAARHAAFYLDFAERWNREIPGPRAPDALDRIAPDLANIEAVLDRAVERNDGEAAARTVAAAAETLRIRRPPRQLATWISVAVRLLPEAAVAERALLLTLDSVACRLSGDWDRAVVTAAEAVGLSRRKGPGRLLSRALAEQGEILRNRGQLDEALAAFAEAREVAEGGDADWVHAWATGGMGMVLGQKRDMDAAYDRFREAETQARSMGDLDSLALHVHNQGAVLESRAQLDHALRCFREEEDLSRRLGNRVRLAVSLGAQANVLVQRGDLDRGLECYREAEAVARELGAKQRVAQIVGNRGAAHVIAGDLDTGLACYEEAKKIARELGDQRRLVLTLNQIGRLHSRREEWAEAIESLVEGERIAREAGDRFGLARCVCDRGFVLLKTDRSAEAAATLRAGLSIFDEMRANRSIWYFAFQTGLADALARLGKQGEARAVAANALELASLLAIGEDYPDPVIRDNLRLLRHTIEAGTRSA